MSKKRKKKKIEGLGDVVAGFTEFFGIDKATKFIFDAMGKDCGCDARREAWNKKYPSVKKPECLTKDEFEFLDVFFNTPPYTKNGLIDSVKHQAPLRLIYNRVYRLKTESSGCGSCVVTMIKEVKKVYDQYKTDNNETAS